MNRMLVPLSATRRKAANRRSTSGPGSDAVGSSSTSSGTRVAGAGEGPGHADRGALRLGELDDRAPPGSIS